MRTKLFVSLPAGCSSLAAQQWQAAQPGYRYEFPRDHFDHPDFKPSGGTTPATFVPPMGRRFGFELTFFRQAARDRPHTDLHGCLAARSVLPRAFRPKRS